MTDSDGASVRMRRHASPQLRHSSNECVPSPRFGAAAAFFFFFFYRGWGDPLASQPQNANRLELHNRCFLTSGEIS